MFPDSYPVPALRYYPQVIGERSQPWGELEEDPGVSHPVHLSPCHVPVLGLLDLQVDRVPGEIQEAQVYLNFRQTRAQV